MLSIYRRILRTAQSWPSIRKEVVTLEIRDEFRSNARELDPQNIDRMLRIAEAGLKELMQGAAESARLRATPRAAKGSWPPGRESRGVAQLGKVEQWALDELGVASASPTISEAKRAYHERAKAYHPDSSNPAADTEAFKRLTRAWDHVQKHLAPTPRASRPRAG